MRKIIYVLVLILAVVVYLNYPKKGGPGTVIGWQPIVYTYKDYKGTPSIDSPAFHEIVKAKNIGGACNPYYTKYSDYPIEEVREYARKDTDAMFEIYARRDNYRNLIEPVYLDYPDAEFNMEKAASLGHVQAKLISTMAIAIHRPHDPKFYKIFEEYEELTPLATFFRMLLRFQSKQDYSEDLQKVKTVGSYNYFLFFAAKIELELNGRTDKDMFCEAYFNGCNLYEAKLKYRINCGG